MNKTDAERECKLHNDRRERCPDPSGTHRIAHLDLVTGVWSAREVPTYARAGVWAWGAYPRAITHLPTGLRLVALTQWRIAELLVRDLGERCPAWGALLGWRDVHGVLGAFDADPEPDRLAAFWQRADRGLGPVVSPVPSAADVVARYRAGESVEMLAAEIRAALGGPG